MTLRLSTFKYYLHRVRSKNIKSLHLCVHTVHLESVIKLTMINTSISYTEWSPYLSIFQSTQTVLIHLLSNR